MHDRTGEDLFSAVVTDITWERIIVTFHCDVEKNSAGNLKDMEFFLVPGFYRPNARFDLKVTDDKHFELILNVTNPGYKYCLPTGKYMVYACLGTDVFAILKTTPELAVQLRDKSRFFIHNGEMKGYAVNFSLRECDEGLYPMMHVMDASSSGLLVFNTLSWAKRGKAGKFFGKVGEKLGKIGRKLAGKFKKLGQHLVGAHYAGKARRHMKHRKGVKNILFMSEQNTALGANLLAVYERMTELGLDREFKIETSFRAIVSNPDDYGLISWEKTLRKMARADIIFVDDHVPMLDWMKLNSKVVLVQLWHAGAGYKSVGYSRWGHLGAPMPICCHRQYTYGITPSSNIAFFFSEQFGINEGQILSTGMPRMDKYLNPEYMEGKKAELYGKYPILKDKKVILFAPTYRGGNKAEAYYPYELIDFDELYEFCADEYVVAFKMHPWVSTSVPIPENYKDRFIDLGEYPNINDLYYLTDIYISDYSSGIFEYSMMKRPALFFAFDELQYSYTRGFHREYRPATPGKICATFDELMEALRNKDYEFEKMDAYLKYHFDHIDTHACDRVIDYIVRGNIPEENLKEIKRVKDLVSKLRKLDFSEMNPLDGNGLPKVEAK